MSAKILYIEDDKISALIMRKLVEKSGIKIDVIHTGEEGVTKASEEDYDLFLIDINLGEEQMSGMEVFKQLRKIPEYQTTPIFAITGHRMITSRKEYLELGFDAYYSKPIKHYVLIEDIKECLDK